MSEESFDPPPLTEDEKFREVVTLAHFIKYNLYLMAKATVFSSIYSNLKSTRDALTETNAVMREFDKPPRARKKLKDE